MNTDRQVPIRGMTHQYYGRWTDIRIRDCVQKTFKLKELGIRIVVLL